VSRARKAVAWAVGVGVAAGLVGLALMRLAEPTSLAFGAGLILLMASPLMAVSMGLAVALTGRARRAAPSAGGRAGGKELVGAPPLPAYGHLRIGYYKLRPGMADGLARRMQGEMQTLFGREAGFVGLQVIRCGADELVSISQWETRAQAEAAVDREVRWLAGTAARAVLTTDNHVGGIVAWERR